MNIVLTFESYLSFAFQLAIALIFTAVFLMLATVGVYYAWKLGRRLIRRVDTYFNRVERGIRTTVARVREKNLELVKRKNGATS
jgi:predicted PurR-regulated permease PerM